MRLQSLRLTLSLTGMLLALGAIALDEPILIWAAIGVLGLSVVLRLVTKRSEPRAAPPDEDDATTS